MKYIAVANKLYEINRISFFYMTVIAEETNLSMDDVPESEVWDISEFERYEVKLINSGGKAEIVDFEELKERHDLNK